MNIGDATADFHRLNLVGSSATFRGAIELMRKYAASDATVLLHGETGTGKELAARAIHYLGPRRDRPFVPVNCGALPDSLVESEFFGHVRGAFTDARESREGLIRQAQGGTLYLDEVEAMTPRAQVTLLRFLQDKDYRPVGGETVRHVDVRVVGSTNADLRAMSRQGAFRSDLLFRLDVLPLRLPPLRERRGDVAVLAQAFLDRLNRRSDAPPTTLDPLSAPILDAHGWPGNVRELENLIQREYVLSAGTRVIRITGIHADEEAPAVERGDEEDFTRAKARVVARFEKRYLTDLMARTAGNVSLAARIAGKDRSDINRLLRKHGIDRGLFAEGAEGARP